MLEGDWFRHVGAASVDVRQYVANELNKMLQL